MAEEIKNLPTGRGLNTQGLVEAYRRLLTSYFLSTLAVVLIISVPTFIYYLDSKEIGPDELEFPLLILIALAGALGAFFSALMRLYKLENLPAVLLDVEFRRMRNWYLVMYSLIPPIIGMIGAVVFHVVIAAGLIEGAAFQKFSCRLPQGCDSFKGLLNYYPAGVQDYAKCLVWGFIAGFSERLVPDALGRMSKQETGS